MPMKRFYTLLLLLTLATTGLHAQQYRTSYFMEGSTMRTRLNPALRSDRGYILFPTLGDLSVNLNSNALTFNTLFYPVGNGRIASLFDSRIDWATVEPHLANMNKISVDLHAALLGAGFYTPIGYWTVELSLDAVEGVNLPKSLVEFTKQGSRATAYEMGGLSVGTDLSVTLSAGYSRRITDELTVGGRINFIGGLARANVTYNRLDATLNSDTWSIAADGTLTASLNGLRKADHLINEEGYITGDQLNAGTLLQNMKGLAGFGMTFDLGAEYVLFDRFKFSAALLNLGFLSWNPNHTVKGRSEASYELEGYSYEYDPSTGEWVSDGSGSTSLNLDGRFKETAAGKTRTKMYPGVVLGAEYDIFGNRLLNAGMLFTHRRNEYYGRTEFSISATVHPIEWFTASLSYAVGNYKCIGDNFFSSFGFALNFHTGWINLFLGTDYLVFNVNPQFIPLNQRAVNFNFGLSIPLGRPHDDWH